MGRHSAPDEAGGEEPRVVAVLDVSTLLSRHSGSTGAIRRPRATAPVEAAPVEAAAPAEEAHTAQIPPVVEPEPSVPEAPTTELSLIEDALVEDVVVEDGPVAVEAVPVEVDPVEAEPVLAESPADVPVEAVSPVPGARASSSDLALIRAHGDVRARCLAGFLVPFVLYAVALLLIGSFRVTTFLLWIWIPLVSAGILVGFFLDSAHKRYAPVGPGGVSGSPDRP